jgi:hypothetical protein
MRMANTQSFSRLKLLVFCLACIDSLPVWAMYLCGGSGGAQYTGSNIEESGTYVDSDRVTHPYKFPKIRKCW